jgi:H+/Cl- antiporter ClcA
MKIIAYALGWGLATFVVLGFLVPAFLWANMPRQELDFLWWICVMCCLIATLFGAWIGRRRTPGSVGSEDAERDISR